MKLQVLCTLGPASLKDDVIGGLADRGVDLFRLNLSHTPLEAVEPTIRRVRELCSVRSASTPRGRRSVAAGWPAARPPWSRASGSAWSRTRAPGGPSGCSSAPATFATLRPGSTVQVDFDGVVLRIAEVGEDSAESVVVEGGRVSSTRAVIVDPAPVLPTLTDNDLAAIEVGAAAASATSPCRSPTTPTTSPPSDAAAPRQPPDRQDRERGRGAEHGRDHRDGQRGADRPRRPLPRGGARARALLPEGDRAARQPLEPPGVRGHQPARVDDQQPDGRPSPRPTTSPTPCWTGSTGWCWRPRRPSASTRSAPST